MARLLLGEGGGGDARHMLTSQSSRKSSFVHQFAARAVDDAHAALHFGQRLLVDHACSLRSQTNMQSEIVRDSVNLVQLCQLNAVLQGDCGGDKRIMRNQLHLKRTRATRYFDSNSSQTDDSQCLAAKLGSFERLLFPFAGTCS